MARPQGRCIFCGGTGLTKEHIWADWLKPHLPGLVDGYNAAVELVHPDQRRELLLTRRTGDPRRRQVRCVCLGCNTGWMSRLQEQCKPFILAIIKSDPCILNKRAQTLLSAWSAMLATTAEFTHREHVAISDAERRWFMANNKPPSHWRVWIGHFPDETCDKDYFHSSFEIVEKDATQISDDSAVTPNTQTTTFRVGHALIHLMSSSSPIGRREIRRWEWRPAIAAKLMRIWPVISSNIPWPPSPRLTANEARFVADRFVDRHMGFRPSA